MENKRFCKRCLLQDIMPDEFIENMRIYLNGLDDEIKADENLYQERIRLCLDCDNLNEGICRLCGCFVEYRAAIKKRACPAIHSRW
ncbi:MAG: hypothetical protein GX359_02715 [Clostridiales bacterium]|nr:hypothetical protein [Clostridiales bacterium]